MVGNNNLITWQIHRRNEKLISKLYILKQLYSSFSFVLFFLNSFPVLLSLFSRLEKKVEEAITLLHHLYFFFSSLPFLFAVSHFQFVRSNHFFSIRTPEKMEKTFTYLFYIVYAFKIIHMKMQNPITIYINI